MRVLEALREVIASEQHPGSADLEALSDIASVMLDTGLDQAAYGGLVKDLVGAFERLGAPPSLAHWIVSCAYLLLSHGAPDEHARGDGLRRLVMPLLADAQRSQPLIPPETWTELVELLEGREDLVQLLGALRRAADAGDVQDDAFVGLAGRTVLLYTLVEAAGRRACEYLTAAAPAVKHVWVDSSSVASDGLRDRARRADVVVVASRAAKHAAYDCIQAGATGPIRYAAGKGWSSLVTAVRDWAASD